MSEDKEVKKYWVAEVPYNVILEEIEELQRTHPTKYGYFYYKGRIIPRKRPFKRRTKDGLLITPEERNANEVRSLILRALRYMKKLDPEKREEAILKLLEGLEDAKVTKDG